MTTKPKRQRKPKEGDVLAIPLGDGTYGFGQVCCGRDYAYFDLRSETIPPIEEIVVRPVVFRVPMIQDSAREGGWTVLGNLPLQGILAQEAAYWNQPVGSNQLRIFKNSQFYPATAEEIKDLEVLGWWYEQHVIERLLDHFEGRRSLIAERSKFTIRKPVKKLSRKCI